MKSHYIVCTITVLTDKRRPYGLHKETLTSVCAFDNIKAAYL